MPSTPIKFTRSSSPPNAANWVTFNVWREDADRAEAVLQGAPPSRQSERQKFEKWAASENMKLQTEEGSDEYVFSHARKAWRAWLASKDNP